MDERKIQSEVSEFTNIPKVIGNAGNLAYCCGGTILNSFLAYKFAINGKTLQSLFFHNAASVLSKKQRMSLTSFCSVQKNIF